jgi:hypothetical protein
MVLGGVVMLVSLPAFVDPTRGRELDPLVPFVAEIARGVIHLVVAGKRQVFGVFLQFFQ